MGRMLRERVMEGTRQMGRMLRERVMERTS